MPCSGLAVLLPKLTAADLAKAQGRAREWKPKSWEELKGQVKMWMGEDVQGGRGKKIVRLRLKLPLKVVTLWVALLLLLLPADATQLRGESENYSVSVRLTKADPTERAPGEQAFLDITIINKVSGDTVSRRSVTTTTTLTKLQILDAEQGGIVHGQNLGLGYIHTVVSLTDATPVDIICDRKASFSPNKVTGEAVRVLKIHAAFERADLETVRLQPAHFVGAPEPVKATLSRLGCQIPQPWGESRRRNLIRGEFMEAGRTQWAVLCSRNRSAAIIVIEEDGRVRAKLASRPDWRELQSIGDEQGYSRGLSPVGRDFILDTCRAFGGPKPPPIDHQGIDDAFIGKYSSVHYFHEGKWLLLQGAD